MINCTRCGSPNVNVSTYQAAGRTYSKSPGALTVILLSIITCGIYFVWWLIRAISGSYDRQTNATWTTLAVCQNCGFTWQTGKGKI